MIETARLLLAPATQAALHADLAHDYAALGEVLGADPPEHWPIEFYDDDAIRYTLTHMFANAETRAWGFLYFLLKRGAARPVLVGAGGFRGPPVDGVVELGYAITRPHRRRGLASEAAAAMAAHAFADARVERVIAHTLPELAASIRVLERTGFRRAEPALEEGAILFTLERAKPA